MAQPTITRISRTSTLTDPYWQGQTSSAANYDRGASGTTGRAIHLYAVDMGTTATFTYAEFFAALNAHADWSVSTSTSGNEDSPSRTFTISYGVANHVGIIALRSGTLMHEIANSTNIVCGDRVWLPIVGSPAQVDNTGTNLADVGVEYRHANTGNDTTAYTGRHEITIGSVNLQSTTSLLAVAGYPDDNNDPNVGGDGSARPVDGGFPQKVRIDSGVRRIASSLKASLAFFGMADGQSCLITDNRLNVEFARSGSRQDFDMCGSGLVEANFSIRKSGSILGFAHNVMTNPNNNIVLNVSEDFSVGGTQVRNEVSGAFEVFSIQPDAATHPYLNQTTRSNAPFTAINRVANGTGGQYFPALTGAGGFNTEANRQRLVLQALPTPGIQYWQAQYSSDSANSTDVAWLDPAITITSNNTPFNRVESGNDSRRYQLYFCRSIGVNNRDAASQPKNSFGYVVGNQKSATILDFDDDWMPGVIPQARTHANGGVWSVRNLDQTGAGLEGVVGRGAHYLIDAALEYNTQGTSAADYTRYTDSSVSGNAGDNVSYLVHRGGINRIQQNQSLRSTGWNLISQGASGVLYNNDVDDIPGLTDNMINMFKDGLIGTFTGTGSLISGASGQITLDGFTNLTQRELDAAVGASLVGVSGHGTITAVSLTNATTAVLTVTAGSSGISYTNNVTGTIYWDANSGYRWDIGSSGDHDITITLQGSTNISWTYSQLAALVQAKIEKIVEIKRTNMGTENAVFGSGNNDTFGGSNIAVNTLLERVLQNTSSAADKSFVRRNTTLGTTLDLLRVNYSVPSGSTLTLNPDEFITLMNYGSGFTIPARVTHNGSYTDSTGTPNFIDIALPTGVATTDVKFAVSYQTIRPLATYIGYTGILSGAIDFDTNGTLISGEWQAVTRPSATGTDTILSTLPTSWNWTPSAAGSVQRVIMRQDTSLTSALRSALLTWINGSETNYVVAANANLSSYAIYEASEAATQGSAIAMNLRLITSTGAPVADDVTWYFNVNSSGTAVTNTRSGGNWTTGATPTITMANNRTFIRVLESESNGAPTNETGVWTLGIAGGKVNPVRQTYTGGSPAGETITLTADALRPASSPVTKSGNITVVPYSIASPGSNSEVKTLLTEDTSYPNDQIHAVTRLGLFINDYNSATDANRTKIDVGDALNSTMAAKYVGVYGTQTISDIIRVSDANLQDIYFRIRFDGVSQVDFLKMDGLLPTTTTSDANYFEVDPADSAARCFFNAPTYSAAEVQGLVEATINEQTEDLTGLLSNVSLGIPV